MQNPVEEEWRSVYTLCFDAYEVSSLGRVRRRGSSCCLALWGGGDCHVIASLYKSRDIQMKIPVHRLVSDAFLERPEGKRYINHIDGNKNNNSASNLRFVPAQHNCLTWHKVSARPSSSRFKGVCWSRRYNVWHSYVVYDNLRYHLGTFDNEVDAARAYNEKVMQLTNNDPRVVLSDV